MPVEPSAIHGINPSGNPQNVAVDANGNLITSGLSLSGSTAAVIASVNATSSGTLLQAANAARKGLLAYNQGTSAVLIAYTTGVSSSNYSLQLNSGAYWEMPTPLSTLGVSVAVSSNLTGGTATILVTELS